MKLYNWNTVEREQLNPRLGRKVIHAEQLTICRIDLAKYAVVHEHSHVNEQVTTVEKGALKFHFGDREQVVRAGETLVIPPNAPHSIEALEDTVAVDVFAPPRHDWMRGEDAYLRR